MSIEISGQGTECIHTGFRLLVSGLKLGEKLHATKRPVALDGSSLAPRKYQKKTNTKRCWSFSGRGTRT